MEVTNKWNNKHYTVISVTDSTVVLKREDGTTVSILKKEYYFSYKELTK